jgi:putative transposase
VREACPRHRHTYGQRLKEAAEKLGKSKRTVQRLVKKWEEEGLIAIAPAQRADKGNFRVEEELQTFIVKTYETGNQGSRRVTRKQVYLRTKAKA